MSQFIFHCCMVGNQSYLCPRSGCYSTNPLQGKCKSMSSVELTLKPLLLLSSQLSATLINTIGSLEFVSGDWSLLNLTDEPYYLM